MAGKKGIVIMIICIGLLLTMAGHKTYVDKKIIKVGMATGNHYMPTTPQNHSPAKARVRPENPAETPKLTILIHDVSPVYFNYLKEITAVISAYGLQNETYLLIIPDHADKYDLRKYPEFVEYLHSLEREGYHIGLHGYTHIGREFDCNESTAEERLENALEIMNDVNLTPTVFLPPRYALSREAEEVILAHNLTLITKDSIIFPNGTEEHITNREYTWYISKLKLPFELRKAKKDYLSSKDPFYLSIHPRAVNNEAGMEFLRKFLKFVKEREPAERP